MAPRPRRALHGVARCPHGGPDHAELAALGHRPGDVLDFSVNSNPLGCHPAVRQAAAAAAVERYADSAATVLARALAEAHGCRPEQVLVTAGSLEALRLAAQAYLEPGEVGVVAEPTFGEYALAIQLAGGLVERLWLGAGGAAAGHADSGSPEGATPPLAGFGVSPKKEMGSGQQASGATADNAGALTDEVAALARERGAKLLYLCQPNNPTGTYLPQATVARLLDALPDTLVVLDEAYVAFVADAWPSEALLGRSNLLVVRSLTKDHALAGLRIGYALGAPDVLAPLRLAQPAWSVGAPAQAAALAALDHPEHVAAGRALALAERSFLQRELRALGFTVWPSAAHFFLVDVGDAGTLRAALLRRGVQVRDCTSFGLPALVRIAPRTRPENERLLAALRDVLASGDHRHVRGSGTSPCGTSAGDAKGSLEGASSPLATLFGAGWGNGDSHSQRRCVIG
ncbi:MAG: histidinol-phosphate aminotransferase family protein [Chloroflexi bacterium]|nr:histidinol-phosphate aminotransferase family protein [Chloroflexota bacterium]